MCVLRIGGFNWGGNKMYSFIHYRGTFASSHLYDRYLGHQAREGGRKKERREERGERKGEIVFHYPASHITVEALHYTQLSR